MHRGMIGRMMLVALILALGGCATRPPASDVQARAHYRQLNDPFEPMNRATLGFNNALDVVLIKPTAKGYRAIFPKPVRVSIYHFLKNLRLPLVFINQILQGKISPAGTTLGRLVINTTIGLAGFFDPATGMGIKEYNEDFGQTLAVWGTNEGAFVMLPVLGPSSVRDGVGFVADFLLDPFGWFLKDIHQSSLSFAQRGMEGIDFRERHMEEIDDLKKSSVDLYAAMRSAYRQHRRGKIYDGAPPPEKKSTDFQDFGDFEDFDDGGN